MGFKNNSFATYWGNLNTSSTGAVSARISISYKSKQTNNFETSFSGFVRFVGNAKQKIANVPERTRIKILECDVVNHYDKATNKTTWTPIIFDFEIADNNGAQNTPVPQHAQTYSQPRAQQPNRAPQSAPSPVVEDSDLPF